MPVLQKPDVDIPILEGKELSEEMKRIANIQGINLSLANLEKTKKILESLPRSLSDEIIKIRENND
ncbi:MAG: hypothetical protein M3530_02405 [Thermoproteota archaeon]|nr:hypothetical protein [Thermoproteota archaeon]